MTKAVNTLMVIVFCISFLLTSSVIMNATYKLTYEKGYAAGLNESYAQGYKDAKNYYMASEHDRMMYYSGKIPLVMFFNRTINTSEMQSIYNNGMENSTEWHEWIRASNDTTIVWYKDKEVVAKLKK